MSRGSKFGIGVVLVVFCLIQLIPFYFGVTTAFKSQDDLSSVWRFPFSGTTMENFTSAIRDGGVLRSILNSAIITVATTLLTCVIGAAAAYPLARRRTMLNRGFEIFTLGVMMVPPLSILVPMYSLLHDMGLLSTYPGLTIVLLCVQLPQAIFLYSQFLRSVPITLEEAASVDGASRLTAFFRIVLPVLKPVTATVVILTAVNVWNEFAMSSYIMVKPEMRTLAPAIASFFGGQGANANAAIAASLIGVIPVIVAYLFLQKYFMKGMLAGAEK